MIAMTLEELRKHKPDNKFNDNEWIEYYFRVMVGNSLNARAGMCSRMAYEADLNHDLRLSGIFHGLKDELIRAQESINILLDEVIKK